jgi:RNA polymerase sigma-70 factor (ECF subfamily)
LSDTTRKDLSPPVSEAGFSRETLFALFTEIRPELVAVLRRRAGSDDVAADLAQDLFVRLASIRTILPDIDQARAYIFRMAVNIAIDRVRSEARRNEILNGSDVLFEDAMPDPEALAVTRDQIRRIDQALGELPPKFREVLILGRVQGLSHNEIAIKLGVSVSLVEKYQRRALRHCRDRLNEEGAK